MYLYRGEPVLLSIDPEVLVVEASEGADVAGIVREILSTVGITPGSRTPLAAAPGHELYRIPGGSSRNADALMQAVRRLADDSRVRFASPGFRTQEGHHQVLLLNELLVRFVDHASEAEIISVLERHNLEIIRAAHVDAGPPFYQLRYPENSDPLAISRAVYAEQSVAWADPNTISDRSVAATTPSDPFFPFQIHLTNTNTRMGVALNINAEPAWDLTKGADLRVAVIDTGVEGDHEDMNRFGTVTSISGHDSFALEAEEDEGPWNPFRSASTFDAHGTSVAGIIAGVQDNGIGITGVAPEVATNSARIFRNFEPADDEGIAAAIHNMWDPGKSDVINNSWSGGSVSDAVTDAIVDATTKGRLGKGAVVVFSTGNDSKRSQGIVVPIEYPATLTSSTSVIAVGAIEKSGIVADYSPSGVDLVALSGEKRGCTAGDILTLDQTGSPGCSDGPDGNPDYTSSFSGTSAAAPQVSGAAALMLAHDPTLTAAQVKERILNAARDLWGEPVTYGAGLLDVHGAVTGQGGGSGTGDTGDGPDCDPTISILGC